MSECFHIEQRQHYCHHGAQCMFVDTFDPNVTSDEEQMAKLHNLSGTITTTQKQNKNDRARDSATSWIGCDLPYVLP